ncbi:MAG: class I SAM-dependent methyltransferase [Gemmatimonadaceae bacterium]
MQDLQAERAFYDELFTAKPMNEHITQGYDELYDIAFSTPPGGLVLDLGCGTGAHSVRLAHRGYAVVSVDLTHPGTRSARQRLTEAGLPAMCVVADAEHLPFRDKSFDTVWAALLLHHFPRLDVLPLEIRRLTRRRLVAFEPNAWNMLTWLAFNVINRVVRLKTIVKNQRALRPEELRRVFTRAGFRGFTVHFVDRGWNDTVGGLARRTYRALTSVLPERFRANKFLFIAEATGQ